MNDSHPRELLSSTAFIVLSLWFSFSGLAAVTGNAAVLWLFCKNDSFRTISNRYLASLSVADLSVGLFVDPLWIVIRCWIKPEVSTVLFRHYTSAVGLHRRRHYFQHLLCFRRPVYFHSVSFPLSGHCDHEKMLRAYNFGVVNLLGSFLLDAFAEW